MGQTHSVTLLAVAKQHVHKAGWRQGTEQSRGFGEIKQHAARAKVNCRAPGTVTSFLSPG